LDCYYSCVSCGLKIPLEKGLLVKCTRCGGNIEIVYRNIRGQDEEGAGVWRYSWLLPNFREKTSLGEGGTVFRRAKRLGEALGLQDLFIKDETRNPTGAFTDRGAAVATSAALHYGIRSIYAFVGGNVAASLAAYAAATGLTVKAFFRSPPNIVKLYQLIFFGGKISGDKNGKEGYRVGASDPFLIEGYKTIAFELWEDGVELDWLVVPVGHGSLLYSIWKGFRELGVRLPRLLAVQPSGCDPIVKAFVKGLDSPEPVSSCSSIASEIAEGQPARGKEVLKALKSSGGLALSVSDQSILEGVKMLARFEGVLAEPASAATVAAVVKALEEGVLDRSESIALLITGAGIKEPRAMVRALEAGFTPGDERPLTSRLGYAILRVLSGGGLHGYGVWKAVRAEGFEVSLQAVYYHLRRLEELGFVRGLSYKGKRNYSLTDKGKRFLSEVFRSLS